MIELLLASGSTKGVLGEYSLKQDTINQTSSWIVPPGVDSICCVCVGHGGCGGGGLSWRNNIPVTPGETLTISFSFIANSFTNAGNTKLTRGSTELCIAFAGIGVSAGVPNASGGGGGKDASPINDGGGNGGLGSVTTGSRRYGGGGAGGYMGSGGNTSSSQASTAGAPDSGSGSGGSLYNTPGNDVNMRGGYVGLSGIGITGAGVTNGGNGRNGSPAETMCGGGDGGSVWETRTYNGGIRIIWGEGYSYPENAKESE